MRERPILFSAPMVLALLDGRKTVTRRIVKGHPHALEPLNLDCPYGAAGDRLWVRETFAADVLGCEPQRGLSYRADHVDPRGDGPAHPMRWTPSIFMRRHQSRITLEIADVRVERLHAITEDEARVEGVERVRVWDDADEAEHARDPSYAPPQSSYLGAFEMLWDQINGERATFASNPFVWRIGFRRLDAKECAA